MGWGDAKQKLCDRIEREIGPMRAQYDELMAHPDRIEEILQEGARKARAIATPFIGELRQAVGLRTLATSVAGSKGVKFGAKSGIGKGVRFVSFRDELGQFRFRFLDQEGSELFCSTGFADPKVAGAMMRTIQTTEPSTMIEMVGEGEFNLRVQGEIVAIGVPSASSAERAQRIQALTVSLKPAE
jgi:tryptophanyl-tRNA synthetase